MLEEERAVRICATEPVHVGEGACDARAEEVRNVKNGMRVYCGEGRKGHGRDRKRHSARREAFEWR